MALGGIKNAAGIDTISVSHQAEHIPNKNAFRAKKPERRSLLLYWWLEAESNCRHTDFQSVALPTELSSHPVFVSGGVFKQASALCACACVFTPSSWRAHFWARPLAFYTVFPPLLLFSPAFLRGFFRPEWLADSGAGGRNRIRTCDIMRVRHALYPLSYPPRPFRLPIETKTGSRL